MVEAGTVGVEAPRRRVALAALVLSVILGGAACGANVDSSVENGTAVDRSQPVATARVLGPAAYRNFLEANPDVEVVNVHVPYEKHIEGTDAFVPFDAIVEWDGLPSDRSTPLAIYCRSGNMSATASEALAEAGYTNIVDLAGGMKAWSEAGFDLVDDDPAGH